MDTSEKGLLRSVPKGFAYCYVEWSNITGPAGSLVHMIEDEIAQHVIKRATGMRQFKAKADLASILLVDLAVCQNHEAGSIALIVLDKWL